MNYFASLLMSCNVIIAPCSVQIWWGSYWVVLHPRYIPFGFPNPLHAVSPTSVSDQLSQLNTRRYFKLGVYRAVKPLKLVPETHLFDLRRFQCDFTAVNLDICAYLTEVVGIHVTLYSTHIRRFLIYTGAATPCAKAWPASSYVSCLFTSAILFVSLTPANELSTISHHDMPINCE